MFPLLNVLSELLQRALLNQSFLKIAFYRFDSGKASCQNGYAYETLD